MNSPTLYNPYNNKNRLFTKTDIQAILEAHRCSFKVRRPGLYQTAMVHSSYVKRSEYITPTGEVAQLADRPNGCLPLFDASYERLEHLGDLVLGVVVSSYLIKRFPSENEGFITNLKKGIFSFFSKFDENSTYPLNELIHFEVTSSKFILWGKIEFTMSTGEKKEVRFSTGQQMMNKIEKYIQKIVVKNCTRKSVAHPLRKERSLHIAA